jgi:hypothetical protein
VAHYTEPMVSLGAVVWHFWLAVPLAASAVLWVVASVAGYLANVTRARYPKNEQ